MVTEVLEIVVKWKLPFAKKASMPKVSKMANVRIAVQKDVQMKRISFAEPMKLLTKTNAFYKNYHVRTKISCTYSTFLFLYKITL